MLDEKLIIYHQTTTDGVIVTRPVCQVGKWTWSDKYMGDQYIQFDIESETPIQWSVGDYCIYRDEKFELNYIPGPAQKAHVKEIGDAFKYEGVKFDAQSEKLGRAIMLDITPTTGDYVAALGTNYTGSAQFQLYCGETTVNGKTMTAVCALAAKIQANLDRAFPKDDWKVLVDLVTTHKENGVDVLNTHTDEKVLSFNNYTIRQALEEVHNTFDLDFCIRGKNILIGYTLGQINDDEDGNTGFYYFGLGSGYADVDHMGQGLIELKKVSDSSQQIVTRLRAMGSSRNLPYRWYNKRYNLSQSLFPSNLQLPDTFEPLSVKQADDATRKSLYPDVRSVMGDTNDAYIDKDDNADNCVEGVREYCAQWDGSNDELEEIYPTIKEVTYRQLRANRCPDMTEDEDGYGTTASFNSYYNDERVDEILGIGDDCNIGDGIVVDDNNIGDYTTRKDIDDFLSGSVQFNNDKNTYKAFLRQIGAGGVFVGSTYTTERYVLCTFYNQTPGSWQLSATNIRLVARMSAKYANYKDSIQNMWAKIYIRVYSPNDTTSGAGTTYEYRHTFVFNEIDEADVCAYSAANDFPDLPDAKNQEQQQLKEILLDEISNVEISIEWGVYVSYIPPNVSASDPENGFYGGIFANSLDSSSIFTLSYATGTSTVYQKPFHIYIKDVGIQNLVKSTGSDDSPVVSITDGSCVAREFTILGEPKKTTYKMKDGRRVNCWYLQLQRAKDTTLYTYYPSSVDTLDAGDHFVLLNIAMPRAYILAAEIRLLVEASKYLADNCNTNFKYEPKIDDIFLQQNYDKKLKEGKPEESLYWKLYAGLKFPFYGPDTSEDAEEISQSSITIESITIKEGEKLTPQVEIVLNDDIEQSTIAKLTSSVDRIYNGSVFTSYGSSGGVSVIKTTDITPATDINVYSAKRTDKQFLHSQEEDTAEEKITFAKGLTSDGTINAQDINATDITAINVTTTTATITNAEVTEKITAAMGEIAQLAVKEHTSATVYDEMQTMLKGVISELVKSADFDEPTQQGFSIDKMDNGKYKMFVTALEVWGKATFNELEVRKLSYAGGNIVLSAAGSTIKYVESVYAADGTTLTGWKCYLLSDDGTTATQNTWVVDDQAKCQTFNIENGTTQAAENRYYWRLVTDVSTQSEQITNADGTPLYDGLKFQWIVLSATDYDTTSTDTPQPGDTIAQMGNRNTDGTNAARTNLIQIVTSGDTLAPFIAAYKGVTGYYLTDNEQVLLLSPTKVRISSNIFEWVSAGGKTIGVKNYRGDWSDTETPYMYYDEVTYQGTLWLCTTGDADGTTEPPSENSTAWKAETAIQRLAMQLEMDGQTTIDVGETINITCRIFRGDDEIDTTSGWTWKATRSSGNTQDDAAWANRAKAKNFTGKIALSLLTTTDTDIPLTSPLYGTTFTFTAQQTGSTVKAAASISV